MIEPTLTLDDIGFFEYEMLKVEDDLNTFRLKIHELESEIWVSVLAEASEMKTTEKQRDIMFNAKCFNTPAWMTYTKKINELSVNKAVYAIQRDVAEREMQLNIINGGMI